MKTGAILFDLNNNTMTKRSPVVSLGNAWASIGGGTGRRVQSIHELPNDVLWLTNLTYSNFYRVGLHRHPNFRNDGWLRTLFSQLMTELGIGKRLTPPDQAVSIISALTQRVVDIANIRHGVIPNKSRLNEDFADALNTPRCAVEDCFYEAVETIANHPSVCVIKRVNPDINLPTLTLRRNRLRHAREVMATPVPILGKWELENVDGKPGDDQFLENIQNPFLVRCTLSSITPMVSEILSWGGGSKAIREWMSDVEWRVIRQYAKVSVKSVLHCTESATQIDPTLLPDGDYDGLSFTNGLVAEQLWTAFTIKQPYRSEKRYSAAAAWLRSADRMIMFDVALKLYGKGINVISYGVGNIVLRLPENSLLKTLDIAADTGLLPPLGILKQ